MTARKYYKSKKKFVYYIWLFGRHSKLDLANKRLLYVDIITLIWNYGVNFWGCASKPNIEVIQRCQNITLYTIVAVYGFDRSDVIHRDLRISFIQDEINKFANKHENRLELHTNAVGSC